MEKTFKSLQQVFAENFSRDDVEGAKAWVRKWYTDMEQRIPEHELDVSYGYTCRAMAGHVSDYLEGYTGSEPESYNQSHKIYWSTKYGSELYWCM
jgi:hypothetical protein